MKFATWGCVELFPLWPGEFARWVRLCPRAGRFGWLDVGRLPPYCERSL